MPYTLNEKIEEVTPDGLISDTQPALLTRARTIRKLGTAGKLVRGTVMAMSSGSAGDGKLVVLGTSTASNETLTPDCILADDVEVGTHHRGDRLHHHRRRLRSAARAEHPVQRRAERLREV